ncbi:unnamed protein product [Parnassius apollo]|uniref:(apollo) hypothetical protein n=1 Tax=Parnassius apollo TaxID=110799 RepID=A0A8S3Y6M6_PARAO|nr:unnamed protein product [Parnassius apollo]
MPKRSLKNILINNLTSRSRDSSQEHFEDNRHQTQTGQVSQTSHSENSFQESLHENSQASACPTRTAKRAAQRVATENDEQRERRLQDSRRRAAQRIVTENEEQREYRLEEQRHRDRRRRKWIKYSYNQNKILAEQYTGVTSFLNQLAEKKNATVCEKIILPSYFPGSTRYYTEILEDAMAIVLRFGSPNFFITMTSYPNRPEIKQALQIHLEDKTILQQLPKDRPDIVARVAKFKFDQIIKDLDKKQVFGKVSAFVYSIKFQKRGLPHMHLLIIMTPGDKIHQVEKLDDLISSEIPQNDD